MITGEQFTKAMHAVVEKRGADYVYPDAERSKDEYHNYCQYVYDGRGSCIIGAALEECGFDISVLEGDFNGADDILGSIVDDDDVIFAAGIAQEMQDSKYDWGTALEAYDRELE